MVVQELRNVIMFQRGGYQPGAERRDKRGVSRMALESDYGELETTDRYDVMQKPSGDMY